MDAPEYISDLFRHAINLERSAETLYKGMAELFSREPAVRKFWEQYANEENGHALYLERVRDAMEQTRLAEQADEAILRQVRYCLEATSETRLESVHNLEDAYRLATEIESSETNAIFSFIIANFSTDELVKSQNFLRVQLEKHATKLEREFPLPYKSRLNRQNLSANKPTI